MSRETEGFFEGKRPWSKIKDRILASYLNPYLAKVSRLGRQILLIDAFAGPGVFQDGSPGSPLFICKAAEKYATGNYQAVFINKDPSYHSKLDSVLRKGGWYPQARAIQGESRELLSVVAELLADQTVFLYIDPFGLNCEFSTLAPFLNRNHRYSTEIVINLSMPILHRLAGREKLLEGVIDPDLQTRRFDLLTRVLGGEYWKEALLVEGLETKHRENMIVRGYMHRLSDNGYLTITGACPIQATRDGATKYYMVFASQHRDSRRIFNDGMLEAFNDFMNQQEMAETLFADLSWKEWRNTKELEQIVVSYVSNYPGCTRLELWHIILQDYFLRFTESEYKKAVSAVFNAGLIVTPTPRKTKKLNDQCVLFLA
jgi:three-Cys-motif partner protein